MLRPLRVILVVLVEVSLYSNAFKKFLRTDVLAANNVLSNYYSHAASFR